MNIKITPPTPTDVEVIEAKNDESLPQQILEGDSTDMTKAAIRQALEIDRDDATYDKELESLADWAQEQTGSNDPLEIKWAIRDLRMRIGTPTYGDAIKHLARFAYLDLEEKRIKAQKREFH